MPKYGLSSTLSLPGVPNKSRASSRSSSPVQRSKAGHKKKKRQNSSAWKWREAEAVQAYLQRQQLWQPADARAQEKHRLSIRGSLSHSTSLPSVSLSQSCPTTPTASALAANARKAPYQRLCGFLPSCQTGIDTLLSVMKLEPNDTFYDLGCGDGRIVISVVKHLGCKGVGVDVNGSLIKLANCRAKSEFADRPDLLERINFLQEDISRVPLADAKAVYIYMPQDALQSVVGRILPCTGIQDGTMIYTEEYWLHDRAALRHCKWKESHWRGDLHSYVWQTALGLPEKPTFGAYFPEKSPIGAGGQ